MLSLKETLMERDGIDSEEADEMIADARQRVFDGEDPEEILLEEFGLEPDYIFDLIGE
jgi:hypothetical protein